MQQPHIIRLTHPGQQVVVQYDGVERVVSSDRIAVGRWSERTEPLLRVSVTNARPITDDLDRTIVRIDLGGKHYCYENPDEAVLGDLVAVRLPNGEIIVEKVQAYGKGTYTGRVYKAARKVDLPLVA